MAYGKWYGMEYGIWYGKWYMVYSMVQYGMVWYGIMVTYLLLTTDPFILQGELSLGSRHIF